MWTPRMRQSLSTWMLQDFICFHSLIKLSRIVKKEHSQHNWHLLSTRNLNRSPPPSDCQDDTLCPLICLHGPRCLQHLIAQSSNNTHVASRLGEPIRKPKTSRKLDPTWGGLVGVTQRTLGAEGTHEWRRLGSGLGVGQAVRQERREDSYVLIVILRLLDPFLPDFLGDVETCRQFVTEHVSCHFGRTNCSKTPPVPAWPTS